MNPKTFTKKLKTEEIDIDGEVHLIYEMKGTERDKHIQDIAQRSGPNGQIKNFSNIQVQVIQMCLRRPNAQTYTAAETADFPATLQQHIYDTAQKLSGVEKAKPAAEEEAKNV